ncbi:fatty acid hydroxylase domain-containing protein 2-like [Uloborus diversus]|uniref:fatty acid hydroxylase domain-containing protein 2-like n=1 Tax=Uloborus diversus TaxID=327109 RepID=UPI0024091354|nr:fatty acid hydroxylase domain-containing protein 2-like [Uloborus diversus]
MEETRESIESMIEATYSSFHVFCGGNEFVLNVCVPFMILLTVYWSVSALFIVVDLTGKPNFIVQFKVPDQSQTQYPRVNHDKLWGVVSQVLFNQTVIAVPVIYACYVLKYRLGYDNGQSIPKWHRFIFDIVAQILTEEVLFYYSHRCLHNPLFYRRYHKKHHEWISPIAVGAIYCHPVEHLLSNLLPTFAGSVVIGCHATSLWAWLAYATFYGVVVHSGYHLPFTPTPEFHHYHHQKFNENFGVIGILDWLHGTDKNFRKSLSYSRDKVLLTLTPLS